MTTSEKIEYLRKEHGLNDAQVTAVLEDYWPEFWNDWRD